MLMTLWVFYSLTGLIWHVSRFYHVCRIPAACTGCRVLPDPAQFSHCLRRHCPPCYVMLSLEQVLCTLAVCFSLLPFPAFAKQGPGASCAISALQSLGCCCRLGWGVTLPQASTLHHKDIPCPQILWNTFKNHFFRNKIHLSKCMQWPEKVTVLLRSSGCRASECWYISTWIQIPTWELQLPWALTRCCYNSTRYMFMVLHNFFQDKMHGEGVTLEGKW